MNCTKCQDCRVAPKIREGKPIQQDNKSYWKQIFTCADTNSEHYNEDIGEVLINIFDQSEVIEKEI